MTAKLPATSPSRRAVTPLEGGWLDFRVMTKLPRADTPLVKTARMAFYCGAAELLALVRDYGDLDPSLLDLLVTELDTFVAEIEGCRR
jgi:hypothetical protein